MLQNLQIRSKLAAILLVPLAAVIVLSSIGIGSRVNQAVKASRAQNASEFAVTLTALVHELQKERSLAAGYVGGGKSSGYSELAAQWDNVDGQVVEFTRKARNLELSGYAPRLRQELREVVSDLAKLDQQRGAINQDPDIIVAQTLNLYDRIIQNILAVNSEIAVGSGNEELLRTVSAFVALSRLKDSVDLQRAYMNAVFSAGSFDRQELPYHQFIRYVEAEDLWNAQFGAFATPDQRNQLANTVVGPSVEQARQMREVAITGETSPRLNVDPTEWYSVMGDKLNLLRQVENGLSGDVVATARDVKDSATRQALIVGLALLAVLLVSGGLSLVIARSMVRPLRQLRQVANEVAEERLPQVVERLQEAQDYDRVALEQVSPVPVSSRDEIGQVAAAFNSVHQVAVRVATEQAALRKSIGDMFLNLARRSQALIDRQLELIDQLERNEADPDALDNLFKLDHLATRMRRNAEDLIVLSGAEPPRRWSQPVPLVDVVRAALAEVEDYQRVELLPIDDIGVAGHAVSDVVHMLAEVIENATSFSPPGTKVQVAGQPVSNGYVLEIEDRGLGMSDEELVEANERLANPPLIDFALSRMLGLFVVARLAQRYGIRVQLRHSWYGGVTALVLMPPSITIRSQVQENPIPDARLPELAPPPNHRPQSGRDHLPIFEQARSDWFESPVGGSQLPLRRHPLQPPPAGGGNGAPHGNEGEFTGAGAAPAGGLGVGGPGAAGGPGAGGPSRENGVSHAPMAGAHFAAEGADDLTIEDVEILSEGDLGTGEFPEVHAEDVRADADPRHGLDPRGDAGPRGDEPVVDAPVAEAPGADLPVAGMPAAGAPFAEPPRATELPDLPSRLGRPERQAPPSAPPPAGPRRFPTVLRQAQAGPPPGPGPGGPPPARPPQAPTGPRQDPTDPPPAPAGPAQGPARPMQGPPQGPMRLPRRMVSRPVPPQAAPTAPAQAGPPPAFEPQQPGGPQHPVVPPQPAGPSQPRGPLPTKPPTLEPASMQTTKAGLPRRVPRANLAPGIVAQSQRTESEAPAPDSASFSRSPDEVRSMLSSYRTGLERGRRMAAGNEVNDRGEGARSGFGGSTPMAPRSDDDAAQ